MKEEGLKQRIEKMRGPRLHWKPKQGGARMKKRVLTEISATIANIKKMRFECDGCGERMVFAGIISKDHPHYSFIREDVLKSLDSKESPK